MSSALDKPDLGRKLVRSDVAYFEAASENINCLGGILSLIPGFPDLSLACVLHSLAGIDEIDGWIQQLESLIDTLDSNWARFYLQELEDGQREQLQNMGYRELVEIGFASRLINPSCKGIALRHCHSESDWLQYTQLSLASGDGPDGFDMVGDSYARVSHMKVDAGYMTPFLAVLHGTVVGFVNLSLQGELARCKNLLVHPDYRDQGIGSATVTAVMAAAGEQGAAYFGSYAIAGEPSVELYKGLGMVEVTRQSEWSRYLGSS